MFNSRITCCYLYPITKYGYPPPADRTVEYIDEMARLGFASIELEGIRREHLLEVHAQRAAIREKLSHLGLGLPYFCAVLPGLSSPDEAIRAENFALFERGCETARALGAKGILDNAPLPPYQFPGDIPVVRHYGEQALQRAFFPAGFTWKRYWEMLIDTFRTLCDIAASHGLTYQLHPAVGVLSSTTDGFLLFFDRVKRDNLRFNFDSANLFAMKEHLPLALLRLDGYIDYIHISDNRGQTVEHLALGDGAIDWPTFFGTLTQMGYRGQFGIDIGGSESGVKDLDGAYRDAASKLEGYIHTNTWQASS